MSPGPLAVRAAVAAVCFALAAAPAGADQQKPKPSASELLRAYPLEPTATATAARTAAATPEKPAGRSRTAGTAPDRAAGRSPAGDPPAADHGGGAPLVPIALATLVAAAGAGAWLTRRRRRTAPAAAPRSSPTAPSARPAPAQRLRDAAGPAPDRTAERLREAAAIRRARQWPWPAGSEDLWRCEIAPDAASLSAHFRAVVHPPGGGPPTVIAESTAGPAGTGDWQSAAPLEQAVAALAHELEARGWAPVEGSGDPQVRRFCRRTPPQPVGEEAAWTAQSG